MTSFDTMVRAATRGAGAPYGYQRRIAEEGLPELLAVPTGCGKTMAAVLPWLYRRRFHSDPRVREATSHWLVFVLPMRTLVEQTHRVITGWLENLGLSDDLACHLLLGGERLTNEWRMHPADDAIIVGTLDMVLSRALNRGYGASRYAWPVDFGLFNAGCQFVFDEIQLMGPALATSRQLHGLRAKLGEAVPCRSMWMSATVAEHRLQTADAPQLGARVDLDGDDRSGRLRARLQATKTVRELRPANTKAPAKEVAAALLAEHRPGTLTLAVLNTVDRARELHAQLTKAAPDAEVVLLHSRFRPPDRLIAVEAALSAVDPGGPGRIVVSTQVVEAGVDISSTVLYTEAAPWPSVVQRAGRCNRDGAAIDALLLWSEPPHTAPYPGADVAATTEALRSMENEPVTPASLGERGVPVTDEIVAELRRRDLIQLFDTQPDLAGNDIDVSRFIRVADDLDVAVAWRAVGKSGPEAGDPLPGRDERCPVPLAELRLFLKRAVAWRWDHLDGAWIRCTAADVRAGMVIVVDATEGGYTPSRGWDPRSTDAVVATGAPVGVEDEDRSAADEPISLGRSWQSLAEHLADVEAETARLLGALRPPGITDLQQRAAVHAARLHDIGKAHPVFQTMLRSTANNDEPDGTLVLAKSRHRGGRFEKDRRYFRHELVSALALLGEGGVALADCDEVDLAVYLVAAHHGRIRVGLRSLPDETADYVLGVRDGDQLPAVSLNDGELPTAAIDLGAVGLGAHPASPSWTARALALRDRDDLGPFRLAYLEAIVRIADWRASAPEEPSS